MVARATGEKDSILSFRTLNHLSMYNYFIYQSLLELNRIIYFSVAINTNRCDCNHHSDGNNNDKMITPTMMPFSLTLFKKFKCVNKLHQSVATPIWFSLYLQSVKVDISYVTSVEYIDKSLIISIFWWCCQRPQ